jgi:hypothetical protein
MDDHKEIEYIFHSSLRDANSWVEQAEKHLLVSEILYKEILELIANYTEIPDEMTRKALALFESYMLLCGLAFENLIKGLIISIKPDFNVMTELNQYKWKSKGGHGIKEMFDFNYPNLDNSEIELIERLEEFLIWIGKYAIPLNSDKLYKSKYPVNKQSFYSTDIIIASELFKKVKIQIEENWKENEILLWRWLDK